MPYPTHYGYLDESYYTPDHEYGSISLLSFPVEIKEDLEKEIFPIIDDFEGEYKWQSFKGKMYCERSKLIFDILFSYATEGYLRIDTIIWQTNDSRYPRNQSNRSEKLSVLFYLRLRDTMAKRWGRNTSWVIKADEQWKVNLDELEKYIEFASSRLYT